MHSKKLPTLLICLLLISSSIQSTFPVEANNEEKITITASNLNVRQGPGLSYSVVGKVDDGESYSMIEKEGDWIKIRLPDGTDGWIAEWFTSKDEGPSRTTTMNTTETKTGKVTADNLLVRNGPGTSYQMLGSIPYGDIVKILQKEGSWVKISYNGENAWVSSDYLTFTNSPDRAVGQAVDGQATVTATTLNVRDQAALDGKVIGAISMGETFEILEESNNWIRIEYKSGETGWAANWFFERNTENNRPSVSNVEDQTVTILSDGTNIRSDAGVYSSVLQRANQGETFKVTGLEEDWYEIRLNNGTTGYVAGWIVSLAGTNNQIEKPGGEIYAKGKTVVIDPGHGGRDVGTIGARGTLEKTLTLKTAKLLYEKLKNSGADVYMTRGTDTYLSLASRVAASYANDADAFISIHYDSVQDRSVRGTTSYYYHDDELAEELHSAVISRTYLKDRNVRFGDYYVIRENRQNSALLELGYLSNPTEEILVTSDQYQQTVAAGLFEGITRYLKQN